MLTLYEPKLEELWFRQQMLADEETMAYNHDWGGTIAFPKEAWKAWYEHWIADHGGRRWYRYLKDGGQFIGEVAWHYDEELRHYTADLLVDAGFRRRGYGGAALEMLCAAAKESGIAVLYDDIAVDNPAIPLFLRHGFTEEGRTERQIFLRREL